jgi:hypothetical protein
MLETAAPLETLPAVSVALGMENQESELVRCETRNSEPLCISTSIPSTPV